METIKKIETYGFECQGGPLENCQDWLKLKDQHERLIWFSEAATASAHGNPALQKFLDGLKAERDNLRSLLGRARPHVDAPLGTLTADIDLALKR